MLVFDHFRGVFVNFYKICHATSQYYVPVLKSHPKLCGKNMHSISKAETLFVHYLMFREFPYSREKFKFPWREFPFPGKNYHGKLPTLVTILPNAENACSLLDELAGTDEVTPAILEKIGNVGLHTLPHTRISSCFANSVNASYFDILLSITHFRCSVTSCPTKFCFKFDVVESL